MLFWVLVRFSFFHALKTCKLRPTGESKLEILSVSGHLSVCVSPATNWHWAVSRYCNDSINLQYIGAALILLPLPLFHFQRLNTTF